jgi:hypothetical protein
MKFSISDAKWPTFREAFLECHKVPVDQETGEPTMSDAEWIKEWGRRMYVAAARQGANRVRDKLYPVVFDPEIIT